MQGRGIGKLECVVQPWLGGAEVDEAPKKVWPAGTILVAKSKMIARAMRSGFKLLQGYSGFEGVCVEKDCQVLQLCGWAHPPACLR